MTLESVLFCQIWSSCEGQQDQRDPIVLRVQAQSVVTEANESIRTYANLSSLCGIRGQAMDLIGDCRLKGATRVIEDLEHADPRQHPRNLLPGDEVPACSALFLPIFDPLDPFSRNRLTGSMVPSAMLEVLVCKTAQMVHNNSDLLNSACTVMDKYKFGVSADTTAFREWSKRLASSQAFSPGVRTPQRHTPRNSMSRTSSRFVLNSDSDTDDSMPCADSCKQQAEAGRKVNDFTEQRSGFGIYSIAG